MRAVTHTHIFMHPCCPLYIAAVIHTSVILATKAVERLDACRRAVAVLALFKKASVSGVSRYYKYNE